MAKNIPLDVEKKANEILEHKRKTICRQVRVLTDLYGIEWFSAQTGLSKPTICRIHSRTSRINTWTICIIEAVIIDKTPMLPNTNFENDKI